MYHITDILLTFLHILTTVIPVPRVFRDTNAISATLLVIGVARRQYTAAALIK